MLDRFVIQVFPNILERIDEGDLALRGYIVYAQPLYFASFIFALLYYVRTYRRSVDMLRRFGRHPEDWEKSDPSLLTRGLSETQQQAVQDIEWENLRRAAMDKERERNWFAKSAPIGIDDKIESVAELHALDSYMKNIRRRKRCFKSSKKAAADVKATKGPMVAENKEIELSSKVR